jgi:hypothetical protein
MGFEDHGSCISLVLNMADGHQQGIVSQLMDGFNRYHSHYLRDQKTFRNLSATVSQWQVNILDCPRSISSAHKRSRFCRSRQASQ